MALHLELLTMDVKLRASFFEFLLVDQQFTGEHPFIIALDRPRVFNTVVDGKIGRGTNIMSPADLEQSPYYLPAG